jgi:ubiquinone/menaquinone biosynthesis C-methylase UbiE
MTQKVSNCLTRAAFYDQVALVYDQVYSLSADYTLCQAAWLARVCKKGPLLDLGCGTGRMWGALNRLHQGLMIGMDCAGSMLGLAQKNHPKACLVQADAAKGLPFKSESFQNVICLHSTLIHVTSWDDLACLSTEVFRVLKPGGLFVAELPHPACFEEQDSWQEAKKGMYYRSIEDGLTELEIDTPVKLTTRVRIFKLADLSRFFKEFPILEVHPGFRGGLFDPEEGDLMVVCARK